jgi:hypothetical protein
MKFNSTVTVIGLKSSKGQLESGQAYDSTKAFILVDMDSRKGRMRGQAAEEFNIGAADVYDKFDGVALPFQADAEFEIVTTGTAQRTVIHSLEPAQKVKAG